MAYTSSKKIVPIVLDDVLSKDEAKEIALDWWEKEVVTPLKAGRFIREKYADSTKKRRKKAGLPVGNIRLYGNQAYDGRKKRMLEQVSAKVTSIHRLTLYFRDEESAEIWGYNVKRFGIEL
jgi:hypothetical protein